MDYLGLLTLGAFVGAIAALGVRYINSVESWQKVLLAILPAVLSGIAITFVDRFKYSPALGCYPLGLVVAFLWTYCDVAVKNIARLPTDPNDPKSGNYPGQFWIGVLHLMASTLASFAALAIVLPPTIVQVRAEWKIKDEDNIQYLMKQRALILAPPKPEGKSKNSGTEQVSSPRSAKDWKSNPPESENSTKNPNGENDRLLAPSAKDHSQPALTTGVPNDPSDDRVSSTVPKAQDSVDQ